MSPDGATDADGEGGEGRVADPADRVGEVVLVAFVGIGGLLGIYVWELVLAVPLLAVAPDPPAVILRGLGSLANGLGTATVGLLFLYWTGRGIAYLDLDRPDRWDVAYALLGVVALVAAQYGVQLLYATFGVESASHGLAEAVEENPRILAALVPASWLFVGPGEELLYRNAIQKSLYDGFPTWGAIAVTSAVFALVHFPAFATADASTAATLASLALVFFLSVVLGWVYARTGNLLVPAFVHGTFNAIQFLLLHPAVGAAPAW